MLGTTAEERIAIRRKRVEARLKKEKEATEVEGESPSAAAAGGSKRPSQTLSVGKQQVYDSFTLLEKVKKDTWDELTAVRQKGDEEENARRILEETARMERSEALEQECLLGARKIAAVELRWEDLLSEDMKHPSQLKEELSQQQNACQAILDGKDRRIREFLTELKNYDEDYVKTLGRQEEAVKLILQRMRSQYETLKKHYADELDAIEQAHIRERAEMRSRNKSEIDSLFDRRRRMEESEFMEARQKREKEFQERLDELRTQDSDDYTKSKISLEKSIQELEQHLERMVATYQLNKEKLDYNLQVLTERNKEHSTILSSYKNRLNRLRETWTNLVARYQKLDTKYKQQNIELTEEYKRLTKQFEDLQEKFHHFELADEKKFREVWEMNEQEARALIAKVLQADRIVHEQQLGLDWSPPREEALMSEVEVYSESGTATGKSTTKVSDESGGTKSRYAPTKVKKVLDLLLGETQFLLDQKVKDKLLDLPPDQQSVVQVDAVLKYLGVEGQEDVDLLVSLFFQGQDEDDETLYVDADDVLRLLKDFLHEKENLKIADVAPGGGKKRRKGAQVGTESESDKKARRRREERKFWERLSHALPEMNTRVWKAHDGFLLKYYQLLCSRSKAIDSAVFLQKQNEELKQLMDQYLQSRVNEELQVPPTHVIKVVAQSPAAPRLPPPPTTQTSVSVSPAPDAQAQKQQQPGDKGEAPSVRPGEETGMVDGVREDESGTMESTMGSPEREAGGKE
ncbi:unnamed protein product [Vitrella brassicaformis CCMP3155]|uniref:Dynein regulatory complex protein 1/2 N-terminal domain-containing protein n=1 Tax=Vitrella brassicaformis (strain CCMP3155) TaxID=1169540 RepID=A0A0G4EVY7_VITBC|nr:unnamed protein product [Vitrella brassicaformis CCMP3155]|eukprot:CEM02485.1 unnamed protein product [Vitrella brassicaformis CCMP3155]